MDDKKSRIEAGEALAEKAYAEALAEVQREATIDVAAHDFRRTVAAMGTYGEYEIARAIAANPSKRWELMSAAQGNRKTRRATVAKLRKGK